MFTTLIPHPYTSLSLLTHHHHRHNRRNSLSSRRRRLNTILSNFSLRRSTTFLRRPSAVADALTWISDDDRLAADHFRGWFQTPRPPSSEPSGGAYQRFLVVGVGTSVVLLLAVLARFSITVKGFRLPLWSSSSSLTVPVTVVAEETGAVDYDAATSEQHAVSETDEIESPAVVTEPVISEKPQSRIITVALDSTQQEAVHMLKKLKIIDDDVKADELCTRRDYARWLVRASSLLERNPKYKISAAIALGGSFISAYEDVSPRDQDFNSIQALAEAGVVSSKLSPKHYFYFSPERFVSRWDLIDWRAQLEYDFAASENHEILNQKMNLLDVREISSDDGSGLLMDMIAGDKSILRRVFGQIRRLQPNKPSTVAQAAVALTSGRMTEAIQNELLRLEAEETSRIVAKEEIKQELLDRGDIERYWAQKMQEEKAHGLEVQQLYMDAINMLEKEKIALESAFNGFSRERAAIDCQKQLLNRLKEEVNEMSEKLISERAHQLIEEENVQNLRYELRIKNEGVVDAKSVLEAEIEALRILRSWIEDEARKSKARSKVLEEVGRRWRCEL
ncbi:uncharacterized protein LOC141644034 [Silene latifolia]|uniref:uncharacterized protein LOC141644034 n=1 Tax=Silene latifolia TaxID=37657 RepID=UPI003D778070